MKMPQWLTSVFDEVRRAVAPTPEELAEAVKNHQIEQLKIELMEAVRGVRHVGYTDTSAYTSPILSFGIFSAMHLPHVFEDLEGQEQQAAIERISEELKALDVDESQIQALILHAQYTPHHDPRNDFPIGW